MFIPYISQNKTPGAPFGHLPSSPSSPQLRGASRYTKRHLGSKSLRCAVSGGEKLECLTPTLVNMWGFPKMVLPN